MQVYLIRHGETPGNRLGRYIGVTEEAITDEARTQLGKRSYPKIDLLFVSPLLRCRQTAEILFPGMQMRMEDGMRECNFGTFENKNWKELTDNPDYQKWIDSNASIPFPNGEDPRAFRDRCCEAFCRDLAICRKQRAESVAFVVHGGTIMSIMERYAKPEKSYYDWHVKNGCGYRLWLEWMHEEGWKINYVDACDGSSDHRIYP